ncbi:hypothetical protein [Solidesulfovibrio sp.]|uniref:hypothetical protein n=1 Tax=Solidesulfovibrio sp. TaxID=2910990 RepID=UPI0026265572|nr:hypothetical protein [Solidesulfovibrio sp.]
MAANTQPIFPGIPRNDPVTLVNADGTTKKSLLTAGANGARVDSLHVATDDTSTAVLGVYLTKSGVDSYLGAVTIPAGAGGTGASPVELLDTINAGNPMVLGAGVSLKVGVAAAVTAGKTLTVVAFAGDF